MPQRVGIYRIKDFIQAKVERKAMYLDTNEIPVVVSKKSGIAPSDCGRILIDKVPDLYSVKPSKDKASSFASLQRAQEQINSANIFVED